MWWELLWTFFAAWGIFSALWTLIGGWLSGSKPITLVLLCPNDRTHAALLRLRWLSQLGFLRCRIIVTDPQVPPSDNTEFCTLADLPARIEAERERFD